MMHRYMMLVKMRLIFMIKVEWMLVELWVVRNPSRVQVEGMLRESFGMVGFIMMVKVRMMFYRMMVGVVVGLVMGFMVDMVTMVR